MGKQWKHWQTLFLGSKITADGDCSHEIKMLTPRKKSYDQPRQHIKKQRHYFADKGPSVFFPVVMHGSESWTIKKAERQRIDAFEVWCWRRLVRVPWTARRFNQSILKEISLEYSLKGPMLKLKLQYFGPLMLEGIEGQVEKETIEDEMAGWHHRLDGHEFEWTLGVGDGQGSLACYNSWGHK